VHFPRDALVYDFTSWEDVNKEFERRGFDPVEKKEKFSKVS